MSDTRITPVRTNLPVRVQSERKIEHPAIQYRNIKTSMSINNEEIQQANLRGADTARRIMERTQTRLQGMRKNVKQVLVNLARKG